jgi:hypothetical protein
MHHGCGFLVWCEVLNHGCVLCPLFCGLVGLCHAMLSVHQNSTIYHVWEKGKRKKESTTKLLRNPISKVVKHDLSKLKAIEWERQRDLGAMA